MGDAPNAKFNALGRIAYSSLASVSLSSWLARISLSIASFLIRSVDFFRSDLAAHDQTEARFLR